MCKQLANVAREWKEQLPPSPFTIPTLQACCGHTAVRSTAAAHSHSTQQTAALSLPHQHTQIDAAAHCARSKRSHEASHGTFYLASPSSPQHCQTPLASKNHRGAPWPASLTCCSSGSRLRDA